MARRMDIYPAYIDRPCVSKTLLADDVLVITARYVRYIANNKKRHDSLLICHQRFLMSLWNFAKHHQ